jgi:hypothetical protein
MNSITTKDTKQHAVGFHREGYNDKPVEIFRDGQIFECYLSHIKVGDSFHFMHQPEQWFKCVHPILKSYSSYDRGLANPTFNIQSLEVLQAAPRVERVPMLDVNRYQHPKIENNPSDSDVIDVEMKLLSKD